MTHEPTPSPRDASDVGFDTASAAWAEAARPVLLEAAGRYRSLVTYMQLAKAVQEATAITTSRPPAKWIGDVLERVTQDSHSRGEPLLSSLCVSVQGSVGEAYAHAVEDARGARVDDPDEHAAQERLDCYRHWHADGLPSDGGTPLRTAHFKTVRKVASRKAAAARPATARGTTARPAAARKAPARKTAAAAEPPKPPTLCPRCFTQVPASGICDYCD